LSRAIALRALYLQDDSGDVTERNTSRVTADESIALRRDASTIQMFPNEIN
jgi:hypothetical protein